MARINISIPDELKEEMDLYGSVNWSKFAKDAFTSQVNILKLRGKNMHAAGLERLCISRNTNAELVTAEAFAAGKNWALEDAEYASLKRVTEIDTSELQDPGDATRALAGAIDDDPYGYADVCQMLDGDQINSIEAVIGFIDGATEVFEAANNYSYKPSLIKKPENNLKFEMLNSISSAQEFRSAKAEEFPNDLRNIASANALGALLDYVGNLDDTHSLFRFSEDSDSIEFSEWMNERLSRYGFDAEEDPADFVSEAALLVG
jgi:hypothetical protein